ncbi:hypothetical protein CsSME_00035198 [Camellia sinensis var. sinensis]
MCIAKNNNLYIYIQIKPSQNDEATFVSMPAGFLSVWILIIPNSNWPLVPKLLEWMSFHNCKSGTCLTSFNTIVHPTLVWMRTSPIPTIFEKLELPIFTVPKSPAWYKLQPLLWTVLALIAVVRVPFYKHWSAELRFALPFVVEPKKKEEDFNDTRHAHVAEALAVPLHIFFTMPWTEQLLTSFSIGRPTYEFPHPLARVPQSTGYWLSYIVVDLLIWWGIRGYINDFRKRNLKLAPIAYFSLYRGSVSHLPTAYMWSPHVMPKPSDLSVSLSISSLMPEHTLTSSKALLFTSYSCCFPYIGLYDSGFHIRHD